MQNGINCVEEKYKLLISEQNKALAAAHKSNDSTNPTLGRTDRQKIITADPVSNIDETSSGDNIKSLRIIFALSLMIIAALSAYFRNIRAYVLKMIPLRIGIDSAASKIISVFVLFSISAVILPSLTPEENARTKERIAHRKKYEQELIEEMSKIVGPTYSYEHCVESGQNAINRQNALKKLAENKTGSLLTTKGEWESYNNDIISEWKYKCYDVHVLNKK